MATKRKRQDQNPVIAPSKKQKPSHNKPNKDEDLDLSLNLNHAMGRMNQNMLAAHLMQRTKDFAPNLSSIELQDRCVPDQVFIDTSQWKQPRTLEGLPSFLEKFCFKKEARRRLSSAPVAVGSPHTLVVTAAGLRAADICRALRIFQSKDAAIAKLFAKHIKLKDAVHYVRQTRISIAVGTPLRLNDLLDAGALVASNLQYIVVDASYVNQKKKGIFDMQESLSPLVHLLGRSEIKDRFDGDTGGLSVLGY